MQTLAQSNFTQLALGARMRIRRACELKRNGDVLQRRHGRDEVKGLEYNADLTAAKARQRILVKVREVRSRDHDRAGVGAFEPRHHHQQRGLSGARGSDESNGLAARYFKIDVFEDMNTGGAPAEREIDLRKRDRGIGDGNAVHEVASFAPPRFAAPLI